MTWWVIASLVWCRDQWSECTDPPAIWWKKEERETADYDTWEGNLSPYWNSNDFFKWDYKPYTYTQGNDTFIKDAWITFYVVKTTDSDKKSILKRLSKNTQFAYLKDKWYSNQIKGINIDTKIFQKMKKENNFYIPIPLDTKDREIDIQTFASCAKEAIEDLAWDNHSEYGKIIHKLITKEEWWSCPKDKLIALMVAFALSESAGSYTDPKRMVWECEYHRRESGELYGKYGCFSFTPYHILMAKTVKQNIESPWLKARKKLKMTEWQTYHPKNAAKLFLWYMIEKCKENKQELHAYFPLKRNNIADIVSLYNGSKWEAYNPDYAHKLEKNYIFVLKGLGISSKHRNIHHHNT